MKYVVLFGSSFVFVVLGHLRVQRKKQSEMERGEFRAAAERAEQRAEQRERTR